jgi:hypothetical protein
MLWSERIRGIAIWLSAEAKRRRSRTPAPAGFWEFTKKNPDGRALSSDGGGSHEPSFATASIYPRKPSVLLHIISDETTNKSINFDVIVYFGRVRGGDVHGRTETEKKGKRQQFRRALRSPALVKILPETIFIDTNTPPTQIAAQLTAFCLRRNIDPDGSLGGSMGLSSPNEIRRQVAEHTVLYFTDPTDPRAYPSYLKGLRERILIQELSGERIDGGNKGGELIDRKTSPKESLKWVRPEKSRNTQPLLSVTGAAIEFGIPKRTLYHWVRTGQLHSRIGSRRRLVLSTEDLEKALMLHRSNPKCLKSVLADASARSAMIEKVAVARKIKLSSARKRINRAIATGKMPPELLLPNNDSE